MKLIHLGDLHLGRSLNDFDLIEDQEYILNQILDLAKEKGADAILICGDLYDKAIPSEAAVRLLNGFLKKIVQNGLKTYIISGNHDSDERLNFGSFMFEDSDIYISAKYDGILKKQTFQDQYGKVNIYLLPFVKASQVRHYFPEKEIETYDQAVRTILESARIDPGERNILLAHQFVAGKGGDPRLSGSENAAVTMVGTVEKIGTDCFEGFDYVALGHIHSPQKVGRETIRYSGSPLKYSLSEINDEKSVPFVEIGPKGEVKTQLLPLKPLRNMRHIKGQLDRLLAQENIVDPEDFIYATLTNEEMVMDAIHIFRQYYENTVKIDYENSHTRSADQIDLTQITKNKSFEEVISDFYKLIYGSEISEDEIRIMKKAAGEVGIDEAD